MKNLTRALLLALASCVALVAAQGQQSPSPVTSSTSTSTTISATQTTSQSVISSLLREQLRRDSQVPATTTTTTTTAPTTSETKVPSRIAASQVVPQQVDNSNVLQRFQFVRPVTTTTTSTTTSTTTTTTTTPQPAPTCQHNNRTYALGQRWNDDCLQVCECVAGESLAISACRPRCPTYKDPPGDNCKLVRDASDECCLQWFCELEAKMVPPSASAGSTTTIMQTERGQLNVSTTEIKMPAPQQAPATTTTTSTTTTTTTTTPRPTTIATTIMTTRAKPTTQKLQAPTTTVPPTTRAKPTATSTTPASARAPKQVQHSNRPERIPIDDEPTTSEPSTSTSTTTATTIDETSLDPEEHHLCILNTEQGWKVNASWQEESCNRICRCVFRNETRNPVTDVSVTATLNLHRNDSIPTEIRCGLPESCVHLAASLAARLVASPQCPKPRLQMPASQANVLDSCQCPEVSCGVLPKQQTITPMTSTTQSAVSGCKSRVGGKLLAPGETFHDECHSICRCSSDGEIRCEPLRCPSEPSGDHLCREWHTIEANVSDNKCCPEFACKTPTVIVDASSTSPPPPPTTTTTTTTTPTTTTSTSISSAQPPTQPQRASCLLLGKWLPHGMRVPEEMQPTSNEQEATCDKSCSCLDGHIVCRPICSTLSELPPDDLECAPELAYQDTTSECCPKWACLVLQKFQVNLINATTLEILLTLPPIALGQRGHFELSYTLLPADHVATLGIQDEPPAQAQWQRRASIKTHDGVFSSRQIKYYWADMKPGHRYWFKVVLRFDNSALDTPIESPLQSVTIPALPEEPTTTTTAATTITSTTTTTTTTTPPIQFIQPNTTSKVPPSHRPATTSTTTITMPTTTTSMPTASPPSPPININSGESVIIMKPTVDRDSSGNNQQKQQPCQQQQQQQSNDSTSTGVISNQHESNRIDLPPSVEPTTQQRDQVESNSILASLSWAEHLHHQVHNAPFQQYAWHLLVAFSIMTVLFTIVSYLYFKKSSRVVAPITPPHPHFKLAYDNPTFKPRQDGHVTLLDVNNQNLDNLAIQRKLEQENLHNNNGNNNNNVRLHHNHTSPHVHLQNGRQRLI